MKKKDLIIVESPAKTRTINKLLNNRYYVLSTGGHVMDIVPKRSSINVETFHVNTFVSASAKKRIELIIDRAKVASNIYLAMDGDREGEGIASHIYSFIKDLKGKNVRRIKFYEITQNAIFKALQSTESLDQNLVDAFEVRRIIDFLIGFNVSPVIWKSLGDNKLSAGRVQSPSLSIVKDRQDEIEAFKPSDYWTFNIESEVGSLSLKKLHGFKMGKGGIFTDRKESESALLEIQSIKSLKVTKVEETDRKILQPLPYRTSTLQRDAYSKLGFSLKRTMDIAQKLYDGSAYKVALITYMRTDSTHLSHDNVLQVRDYIEANYQKDFLGTYRKKHVQQLHSQEAHEAIRPVNVNVNPDSLKDSLDRDSFNLYAMIWKNNVASQMKYMTRSTLTVEMQDNKAVMIASYSRIKFAGWGIIYEKNEQEEDSLPHVKLSSEVVIKSVALEKKTTVPPRRLNQSSLLKQLETLGIGRPSTYANILETLHKRGYVTTENKSLVVSEVGLKVNDFLHRNFPDYMNYSFTAHVEAQLDAIANAKQDKLTFLKDFWSKLDAAVKSAHEICPKCKIGHLVMRKKGMIGCSDYFKTKCDYTRFPDKKRAGNLEVEKLDTACPKCNSYLVRRKGIDGSSFTGCSAYPKCKYMEVKYLSVPCYKCGAKLRESYSKAKDSKFYACSAYPKCKNTYSIRRNVTCTHCGSALSIKLNINGPEHFCLTCQKPFNATDKLGANDDLQI